MVEVICLFEGIDSDEEGMDTAVLVMKKDDQRFGDETR